jgi:hypothetical protein
MIGGHSYGLIGNTGMGKTSILQKLQRKLQDYWIPPTRPIPIPAYISITEELIAGRGTLLSAMLAGLLHELETRHTFVVSNAERKTLFQEAEEGNLERPVRAIVKSYYRHYKRSCRPILLLDDLQRGQGYEVLEETISLLRPLVSPTDDMVNLSLVLASEVSLEREFRNDVSSLRAILSDVYHLEPLTANDVETLMEPLSEEQWPVEPGSEQVIFELTKGHPFKLHFYLFTALSRHGQLTPAILQGLYHDVMLQQRLQALLKQQTSPSDEPTKTVHILYLYAEKDSEWVNRFEQHLAPMIKYTRMVQTWHAGQAMLGTDVDQQDRKHLKQADIIVLFISSDYVSSKELKRQEKLALARHKQGTLVIPLRIRPVGLWKLLPYNRLEPRPRRGQRWLSEYSDSEVDRILAEIADDFGRLVEKLT